MPSDDAIASTAAFGVALDGFDLMADVLGGFGRFLRELFHFVGHHGKPLARFSGARRFDRRIQGEQVGLLRDRSDHLEDMPDFGRRSPSLETVTVVFSATLTAPVATLGGFGRVLRNLPDAGAHFFGSAGNGLQVLADCLGRL